MGLRAYLTKCFSSSQVNSTPAYTADLDKQLDRIAKRTMQDYKQIFKRLEDY